MSGDVHVRFCESQGLQYPWPLTYVKKKNRFVRAKAKKAKRASRERRVKS
jgi:hypothetical protein